MSLVDCDDDGICEICRQYVGKSGYGHDPRHDLRECVSFLAEKVADLEKELCKLRTIVDVDE